MKAQSVLYPVWFCDVWGVLHDGYKYYGDAAYALAHHRQNGGTVVLLTNSPRTSEGVARQLDEIGVPPGCYDLIVTSGDVTQTLVTDHARGKVFHLGPERDLSIFDGLEVEQVSLAEAHAVLCTGLLRDDVETPDDYDIMLGKMRDAKLPMICANPDKLVRKGNRLLYCAGALAEKYQHIGGKVLMAGKPYKPIYELALRKAEEFRGETLSPTAVLAIGDGPETDIKGAADFGADAVLIADGVTDASKGLEFAAAQVRAQVPHARIIRTLRTLTWN